MQEQSMYDFVENIVTVVFYKYFSYVTNEQTKQDLFQEGYLKAYELLNNGNYDPSMSLRNFIYTGVRNTMTNYMYHHKKENHVDLDTLDKYENIVGVDDVLDYDIDIDLIKRITNKYKTNGDYFSSVMNYLFKIGLTTHQELPSTTSINPMIEEAVIVEVLWELCDNEASK